MSASPRDTALEVLSACRDFGAWSDGALKKAVQKDALDSRDAAFAARLCYGVLQNQALLDYYIGCYCTQRTEHLEHVVREVLRLGAYQILWMDRVPDSAAVNQAVEQIRRCDKPGAAGLVNAVLRKISDHKNHLPAVSGQSLAQTLSLRTSHPQWLVERFLRLLGASKTEQLLTLHNAAAPTTVQVNPLKTTAEALERELTEAGVTVRRHPWLAGCLELSGTGDLTRLDAFQRGAFLVQDAAARLVAVAAGVRPGDTVIDVCAAPGGKSFSAAFEMQDQGRIFSCDIHPHKLKLIESGAKRLGLTVVEPVLADGRKTREDWIGSADAVIVDAPCSGLGIIRKKPDIRYKDPRELAKLPAVQGAILAGAAAYVKPGGTLLYSTCTVLPEENEAVTAAFLEGHPDFRMEAFSLPFGSVAGQITLWPQRNGTDGFYICRMRKNDT